ncbi:DUF4175 domain-containing protein [Brevibacterium casei]|uniref:hypothetical protein n=1 Tax=Brevibacterium casei TaxID=33889 RepID=UPI00186B848B|nr:hypothetical protein [Brevibacterium casei]MBE4693671.1 hypothetical protein [Brevibacterium casei]MBY3576794.1 DUF4175 domain-containing protein [Brevibacterium casei]
MAEDKHTPLGTRLVQTGLAVLIATICLYLAAQLLLEIWPLLVGLGVLAVIVGVAIWWRRRSSRW